MAVETALRVERRVDGRLWLVRPDRDDVVVRVVRPFPWSSPDQFVSLMNDEDQEEALIRDLCDLDEGSRSVLVTALAQISFVLDVTAVERIDTEFEIRNWCVRTEQGEYRFQTKHDDWPYPLQDGALLLRDLDGNLFRIQNPARLDARSRQLLWAYADIG